MKTVFYLLNRLPTKALKNMTPYKAWNGTKPSVEHAKVFGCICYAHVPTVKRDKLDVRADFRIFIGNSLIVKGYRVHNLKTKKIQVSRDVKFDELARWNWDKKEIETATYILVDERIVHDPQDDSESDDENGVPVRGT